MERGFLVVRSPVVPRRLRNPLLDAARDVYNAGMVLPPALTQFAEIIIDSYFIIDHNIVDYNRAFHSMMPRTVARTLKTRKCHEVLRLNICSENCIARQCWAAKRHVRLDEITGRVPEEDRDLRFILSAIPIYGNDGELIGAMEMQRNVTDEALVQIKYQQQMEASARQQQRLEEDLRARTRRLLDVSRRLYTAQRDMLRLRTELFG